MPGLGRMSFKLRWAEGCIAGLAYPEPNHGWFKPARRPEGRCDRIVDPKDDGKEKMQFGGGR